MIRRGKDRQGCNNYSYYNATEHAYPSLKASLLTPTSAPSHTSKFSRLHDYLASSQRLNSRRIAIMTFLTLCLTFSAAQSIDATANTNIKNQNQCLKGDEYLTSAH